MNPTTDSLPVGLMQGWFKGALLAALVFAAFWAVAIFYWRGADHGPSTADLVLYLLVIPFGVALGLRFARDRFYTSSKSPAVATPVQVASARIMEQQLAMVAASLRSPYGDSPEELAAALADNTARADLDNELVDDDGFPVLTLRCGDAIDEALQEEVTEWWNASGIPQPDLSDEQWRAVTLASAVAGELASRAAADLMPADGAPPMLRVVPILPAEWQLDQCQAVATWLKHTVAQFGWPSAYIALADQKTGSAATPSATLSHLAQDAATGAPFAALVVACASNIGEETVARWGKSGSLFTSSQPRGLIPGEGAAGLLLTDPQQARSLDGVASTLLDPVTDARLKISADDAKRSDSVLLADLSERVLKAAVASMSDVTVLVGDTGHRADRVLELMGFASGAMPQLDGVLDVVRAGTASGTCGAVPFMMALALARHHALERVGPVLCVSNEDPYLRCATLVRPLDESHASA